jgi:hypothetical protein
MAGHKSEKGSFYLSRSAVEVPDEIRNQIFPFIDDMDTTGAPTLRAFFNLLVYLRKLLCQYVALMMLNGVEHILFTLPIFQSEAFEKYRTDKASYLKTHAKADDPGELLLNRAIPVLVKNWGKFVMILLSGQPYLMAK